MTGLPLGLRRFLSDDLIWYGALRAEIYARQLLEQSEHILLQIEDEDAAQKVGNILAVVDEHTTWFLHVCSIGQIRFASLPIVL